MVQFSSHIPEAGLLQPHAQRRGKSAVLAWLAAVLLLFVLAGFSPAQAELAPATGAAIPAPVDLHFFHTHSCPHCQRAAVFLQGLAQEDEALRLHAHEVSRPGPAREAFLQIHASLQAGEASVPMIVVGQQVLLGFAEAGESGAAIRQMLASCRSQGCADSVRPRLQGQQAAPLAKALPALAAPANPAPTAEESGLSYQPAALALVNRLPPRLDLPLLGEVDTASLSLPVLTVLLAALDGFNPCAMWVLVFLLGLLAGLGDRRRTWILGGAFLLASGLVYFLILAAWLNAFLLLGLVTWIRVLVAVFALGAGVWYLREYFNNPEMVCQVTAAPRRRQILERLRQLALHERLWPALLGVVLLALAVNVVEFLCSAGIPAVFTQVLALSQLPLWQYYAYLLLYLLVFLLDDLVVFALAVSALQWAGQSSRYTRWSRLLGGALLLVLGAVLLLRPEWLHFV